MNQLTPLFRLGDSVRTILPIIKLHELPIWEGDREFSPLVFDGDPRPSHGVMPYRDGRM